MNKTDSKILKELLLNSRQSLSKIGKTVRLSRENVHYRIQKLIEQKIIREFVTEINYEKLGFSQYTIFLKYKKITENQEKELISFLQNQDSTSWIGLLTGKWSLTFDIYAKNFETLNKSINKIFIQFKDLIGDYLVLNKINSEYYFNKIIDEKIILPPKKNIEKIKLDNLDKELLKKLNENAKITYTELSEQLKLTPNGIKQRYNRLKKKGLIFKHSISIDHKVFGFEWHGLQIKLTNHNPEIEIKLKQFFKISKEIIFYYQYAKSGIYDFDIGVIVKNSTDLRQFINQIRSKFYGDIEIYDTFLVLKEVSSHKLPNIIFKNEAE